MRRIVFLERNTFTIDFPRPNFDHEWIEYGETRPAEISSRLAHADIAIVNKLPLREPELSLLPDLKLIAVAATGVDNIELPFCRSRNIAVCNTRGYAIHSLPEHVLMLILALRRSLIAYKRDLEQDKWQKASQFCLLEHPIGDLYGSTLGIIGYGSLGQSVDKLAKVIGMRVLVAERRNATKVREGRTPFTETLKLSDVITLHCPLIEETRGLIDSREFDLMKASAILINTARGGLVNEVALVRALQERKIAGAGIDVLSTEPPCEGNVLLETGHLPNLIVTPHIAWASQNAMQMLAEQLVDNLEAFVRGEPKNLVSR